MAPDCWQVNDGFSLARIAQNVTEEGAAGGQDELVSLELQPVPADEGHVRVLPGHHHRAEHGRHVLGVALPH